jgi:hypothetical protein
MPANPPSRPWSAPAAPPVARPTPAPTPAPKSPAAPPVVLPIAPVAAPVAEPVFMEDTVSYSMFPGPPEAAVEQKATVPMIAEPPAADAGLDFGGDGPVVRRKALPRSSSSGNWILLICGALLLIGLVVGGYFAVPSLFNIPNLGKEDETPANVESIHFKMRNLKNAEEKAFRLLLPQKQWLKDDERKNSMGVNTAWQHDKEAFWFAVYAKDYGLSKPRDAELLEKGIERLEGLFGAENLELAAKAAPGKLGDLPALSLTFKGQASNQVSWWGEMIMAAHQGIGYWLFVAAPKRGDAVKLWEDLQTETTGLRLAGERRGWQEQPPEMVTFTGESGGFRLTSPKGVWNKEDVKEFDERGELLLFGRYQREKDNRKNAVVLISTLESRKGNLKETMKAAREYFEAKKKEENKNYNLTVADNDQSEFGAVEGSHRVLELKLSLGDEPKRYVLLAVTAGQPYLIQCDCTWESRQIWRQDFLELLRSMTTKKGAEAGD